MKKSGGLSGQGKVLSHLDQGPNKYTFYVILYLTIDKTVTLIGLNNTIILASLIAIESFRMTLK
jgi:hypothetical protein